jgi:hypothetical protein
MNLRTVATLGLLASIGTFAACQGEINPQPLPPGTSSSSGQADPSDPTAGGGSSSGRPPFSDAGSPAPSEDAGNQFDSDASPSDAGPTDASPTDASDASDATTD